MISLKDNRPFEIVPKEPPNTLQAIHCLVVTSFSPFYITFAIRDLLLHHCIRNSRSSINIIPLKVVKQLKMNISRPYKGSCVIDSKKMKVLAIIKDILVKLSSCPSFYSIMDALVIDISTNWGMTIGKRWLKLLHGCMSDDLSHANISIDKDTYFTLHREALLKY